MIIKERDGERWAEIFWDDLSEEVQEDLLTLMGDNGNYDVFPLASINVSPEEGESE